MCKGKNNISLKRLLRGLNERMGLKRLVQCLTHTVGAEHVLLTVVLHQGLSMGQSQGGRANPGFCKNRDWRDSV